jgi:hypothetical protein
MDRSFDPDIKSLSNFAGSSSYCGVVSRERFAETVGLPLGVIVGFCNKGYLPTVSIGKYSLINVELLLNRLRSKEFDA